MVLFHCAFEFDFISRDTVALMLQNRPEMVAAWLGMGKIGVASALINTNSTGKALTHAIKVATEEVSRKIVIIDNELRKQISEDLSTIKEGGTTVLFWEDVYNEVKREDTRRPDKKLRSTDSTERDPFLYVFTSGTTGLPKASKISHSRFFIGTLPLATMCNLKPGCRVYNTLPLYHSAVSPLVLKCK